MTGFNHALTGVVVAVAIKEPALALPAAFLSHFAIDMLPHWNYKIPGRPNLRRLLIGIDLTVSSILIICLAFLIPEHGWLAFFGGFLAIAPDAMWLPYILTGSNSPTHKKTPLHLARRFHFKIQWSESAAGLAVEACWFVLMFLVLIKITT